jgi:hypothetical protein
LKNSPSLVSSEFCGLAGASSPVPKYYCSKTQLARIDLHLKSFSRNFYTSFDLMMLTVSVAKIDIGNTPEVCTGSSVMWATEGACQEQVLGVGKDVTL